MSSSVQKHRWITQERIDKFLSDLYWTDCNLQAAETSIAKLAVTSDNATKFSLPSFEMNIFVESQEFIEANIGRACAEIDAFSACPSTASFPEPAAFCAMPSPTATPAKVGDQFGPLEQTFWFKIEIRPTAGHTFKEIPDDLELRLLWHTGSEGTVRNNGGEIICGVSGEGRDFIDLRSLYSEMGACEDGLLRFSIEMVCGSLVGDGDGMMIKPPNSNKHFSLQKADLIYINKQLDQFRCDMEILLDFAQVDGVPDFIAEDALQTANSAVNAFRPAVAHDDLVIPFDSNEGFKESIDIVDAFFGRHSDGTCSSAVPRLAAVGHCHIDTAWLWRYRETRRKVIRSWSSQLHLMNCDRSPTTVSEVSQKKSSFWRDQHQFIFAISQPLQMKYLKEHSGHNPASTGALRRAVFNENATLQHATKAAKKATTKKGQQTAYDSSRVRHGESFFEPLGASWVEMDGNLPTGESFCRQFLYGQHFLQLETGSLSDTFWLPDTFGYAGQLPQIAKHFGCQYFLSQKLSWNLTNKPPHTTFWWKGIDGCANDPGLLAHFPPADNYGCDIKVEEILKNAKKAQNRDMGRSNDALWLFGRGDGGGGPSKRMLQRLHRFSNMNTLPVKIETTTTVADFFQRVKASSAPSPPPSPEGNNTAFITRFPQPAKVLTHKGELYFEMHRGTFSTWRRLKHMNMVLEQQLMATEGLNTALMVLRLGRNARKSSTTRQPQAKQKKVQNDQAVAVMASIEEINANHATLTKLWKLVLLNQFHDVLPGTSIPQVNEDASTIYEHVASELKQLAADLQKAVLSELVALELVDSASKQLACNMKPVAACSGDHVIPSSQRDSTPLPPTELVAERADRAVLASSVEDCQSSTSLLLPAHSLLLQPPASTSSSGDEGSVSVLVGDESKVQLQHGNQRIWLDKRSGAVALPPTTTSNSGKAPSVATWMSWALYDDVPLFWDAWDVEAYHREKPIVRGAFTNIPSAPQWTPQHANGASASTEWMTLTNGCRIRQTVSVNRPQPSSFAIDQELIVDVDIEWQENHRLLKLEFDTGINAPHAVYGTAFGVVERPTHSNDSIAAAKFENCFEGFVDVYQHGKGVAVLTSSGVRGASVSGGKIALSVLRAPANPDPTADRGFHSMRFVVLSHSKPWQVAQIVERSLALCAAASSSKCSPPPISLGENSILRLWQCSSPSVVIHSVKRAELDEMAIVFRLSEIHGSAVEKAQLSIPVLAASSVLSVGEDALVAAEAYSTSGLESRIDVTSAKSQEKGRTTIVPPLPKVVGGGDFGWELPPFASFEIKTITVFLQQTKM